MGSIHYRTRGNGQPIIFIHGFCETSEIWDPFVKKISGDFKVVTLDLPGFGASKLPDSKISIENIASRINDWVIEQGFEDAILIGHSLGGYVVLAMIAQRPGTYSGFVLFHSTSYADTPAKRENRYKVMEFVQKNGVGAFTDSFVPGLYHIKDHPSIAFAKEIAEGTSDMTFLAYTEAMRDRVDRQEILINSEVPVLILAGSDDSVIPIEGLTIQARLNDKIALEVLSGVGHMGMFEAEDEAAGIINRFALRIKGQA